MIRLAERCARRLPSPLRQGMRYAGSVVPRRLRLGRAFRRQAAFLRRSERWDASELERYRSQRLAEVLGRAARRVPYYRRLFAERGIREEHLRSPTVLSAIPLLNKETVLADPAAFLAPSADPRRRVTTGASSGRQLSVFVPEGYAERELAFAFDLWGRIGYAAGDRIAVLRGEAVRTPRWDRPWRFDPLRNELLLSIYDLTDDAVPAYLEEIRRRRARFLHCYPSAALVLARVVRERGLPPPDLAAVLTSSENLSPGQREFISSALRARVFDLYGLTESAALAGECEKSRCYHVYPQYSWVEIVDPSGRPVVEDGGEGEIVGTGFLNTAMPLIRYRTGDWAVVKKGTCACGRSYPLLSGITGRRNQEAIVGRDGNRVPLVAINPHSGIFNRVRRYQFRQEKPGRLELVLVRGAGFSEADAGAIRAEISGKLRGAADLVLSFAGEIPLTPRGKHALLVQRCPGADGP